MTKLAILGGSPVLEKPLPTYPSIGERERKAVARVMETGSISAFYGSWGPHFNGGAEVKKLEALWCETFRVAHAVSVNSATSGLIAALGAIGISPGDEVIVPPFTMSATVVSPLFYGAIPVFADIDEKTFCLDVEQVKKKITPRTKAIMAVNLFGHPAPLHELRKIADEKGIYLIEDNAQSPFAMEFGKFAGTVGHIGIFSLNYHKHIHSGEGGVCVTNDKDLALRLALIRNHGENSVEKIGIENIENLVGMNLRLSEVHAAIATEQLLGQETHMTPRLNLAEKLSAGLNHLKGFEMPHVREGSSHVYYLWVAKMNPEIVGCTRTAFSQALTAEGVPHLVGYLRPLYKLPVFQKKIAIGKDGYPFKPTADSKISYGDYSGELCPVAEKLYAETLMGFETCAYDMNDELIQKVISAFHKVYEQRAALKDFTSTAQVRTK